MFTGGDGYWGSIVTLSRGKTIDAVIITVELPEYGIPDPEKWADQFFENMEPIGKKRLNTEESNALPAVVRAFLDAVVRKVAK